MADRSVGDARARGNRDEAAARRLLLHCTILDRLMREPGATLRARLEQELGPCSARLALAAAGVERVS
jgi:hypothetical protein